MTIGFDTASTITDAVLDKLAEDKGEFVCVYFKYMSDATLARIATHNMKVVSVFETTAGRALGGAAAGTADGKQAYSLAMRFSQPTGSAIYATADFDVTAAQQAAVAAYFQAFKAQIGDYRLGVYANGATCKALLDAGIAHYTWLAGGSGMRGTKEFAASGRATIIQDVGDKQGLDVGISIDSDTATIDDYGGWAPGAPPAPDAAAVVTPAMVLATVKLLQTQVQAMQLLPDDPDEVDGILGAKTAAAAMQAYRLAQAA